MSRKLERHGATAGGRFTREYRSYASMIDRCENPAYRNFHRYGGRGIKVCPRWRQSFKAFLADMGPRPEGTTIDRIDGDRDYEPGNCRWATPVVQNSHSRRSVYLSLGDVRLTRAEWARRLGCSTSGLERRQLAGWSDEQTLTTPFDESKRRSQRRHQGEKAE